jgi:hypothetical protein
LSPRKRRDGRVTFALYGSNSSSGGSPRLTRYAPCVFQAIFCFVIQLNASRVDGPRHTGIGPTVASRTNRIFVMRSFSSAG